MNAKTVFTLILIIFSIAKAHAGYDHLMKSFDAYKPPAYLPPERETVDSSEKPQAVSRFQAEKKRIDAAISRWESSLRTVDPQSAFFRPDPIIFKAINEFAQDERATAEMLEGGFSLKSLESLVLLRNPGVNSAEKKFRAAIEGFSQVTALDEILRRYTAFTEGVMPGVGPMKGKDSIKVKFPFPGVLALKGEIAEHEVRMAREVLESARRDALTSVRRSFWRLLYNRKAQQITFDMLNLLKHLEEVAITRYEVGKTSFQDVIKVGIERDILNENLLTIKERQQNIEVRILEDLNLNQDVKLGSPIGMESKGKVPSLSELYDIAFDRKQELRRLRAKVAKMELMIEMAETMILPPFSLNFSLYEDEAVTKVGTIAKKETFPVSVSASEGAGLPKMPWYGTSDAYIRQTRQELLALKADLKKLEKAAATRVRMVWFELDRAIREENLYRSRIVDRSKAVLDVSTRGYESGKVSFADVISSYTLWLQTNLTMEKKRTDIGITYAELEKAVGTTLRD